VHTPAPRLTSRRALLRGALAVAGAGLISPALAACGLFGHSTADSPPTPALEGLLAHTVALGHQYDTTITAVPALAELLTPLRDAHRAHADAIAAAIGRPVPSPAPSDATTVPTDPQAARSALATAEKTAQAESLAACLSANDRLAPLLGSITAARAAHQEVLQ
jgi:hypothetical protein